MTRHGPITPDVRTIALRATPLLALSPETAGDNAHLRHALLSERRKKSHDTALKHHTAPRRSALPASSTPA